MSRAIGLAALGLIGCGRLGFSQAPSADAADGPVDAPPVPASICKVERIPVATPTTADLAITGTAEGYAAIWVDPSGATEAHGMVLSPDHQVTTSITLAGLAGTRLGGITDVGQRLAASTSDGVSERTWILARDLSTASSVTPLTGYVMAHGSFPSDTSQSPRVFVAATGTTVTAAYMATDGTINQPSTVSRGTTGPVTELACADGPDHSHCVWVETIGTASQCTATDVRLQPVPSIPGGPVLSSDCHDVRTSSGPDAADSMMVTWVSSTGVLDARYVGGGGLDVPRQVTAVASAPKVQFDGKRFWIAWLDGRGVLHLSAFELDGTIASDSLAGWVPLGPEAFELVHRGAEAGLVMLSAGSLDFLTLCP